jgi:hypothetical protein
LYFFGSEQEVSEDYVMRNSKRSWTSHFPCGERPCSINTIIIIIITWDPGQGNPGPDTPAHSGT